MLDGDVMRRVVIGGDRQKVGHVGFGRVVKSLVQKSLFFKENLPRPTELQCHGTRALQVTIFVRTMSQTESSLENTMSRN